MTTKQFGIVAFAVIGVALLGVGSTEIPSAAADGGRAFSERDIRGPYGYSFDGFAMVTAPDGTPIQAPVTAVGQFVADGNGRVPRAVRTLNLGGIAVLEQVARGSYRVNPDGTGTARFRVETVSCRGCEQLPVEPALDTVELFSFVINRPQEIQFALAAVLDPSTLEPAVTATSRGVARRQ